MKPLHFASLGGVALALALLPGCSSAKNSNSGAPKTIKVGFVSNNPENFWTIAEAGANKATQDLTTPEVKIDLSFKRPQPPSAAVQKQIIEDLLSQNVQAIAISVIDPANQTDFLDEIAAKIPLITQDNDAPKSKRKCYIGTDNYSAGLEVGKLVKEVLPDGGTIAIFVGQTDPLNARQRRQGVLDELAGMKDVSPESETVGKYKLLGTFTDGADRKNCKDRAADVISKLKANPAETCFVGLWAYNPPAILEATKDAKLEGKLKIVGFDEENETLFGIKDGHIHATVVQQPFEFGYQSVKLMTELVKNPAMKLPANGIQYVPHKVIKKDNVAEFHKNLRQMLGQPAPEK
jgi:ribose transport system substrate-binding protein